MISEQVAATQRTPVLVGCPSGWAMTGTLPGRFTLSPGVNGELGLTSTVMHELGGLKSFQGNQLYEISSQQWGQTPAIGCVIVDDYPARTAYGTAYLR